MSDANTLVQQAKKAYTSGDKAKAKELLLKAVDLDEHNEQAWMWMSAVVSSMEEQQICLENVLSINPNNEKAQKGLQAIQAKLGKPAAPAATPASKQTDIFAGIDFNAPGNPFTTDHGWGDASPAATPTPPPPAPAPSAWGDLDNASADAGWGDLGSGSSDSGWGDIPSSSGAGWGDPEPAVPAAPPAAYGSDQQVAPPSGAQLDDWISNMGIGSPGGAPSASPFDMATPAPAASDPFAAPSGDTGDPWANAGGDIWGGNDPWAGGSDSPAESTPAVEETSADPWSSVSDPFSSSRSTAKPAAPTPAAPKKADPFTGSGDSYSASITDLFGTGDPFDERPAPASDPFGGVSIYENEPPASKPASSKKAAAPPPAAEPASFDFGSESDFVFDEDGNFFDDDRPVAKPAKAKAKSKPASTNTAFDFGAADDEDDDLSDPFAELDEKPIKRGKAAVALSPHYDLIPDELRGSGGGGRGLMVAAAVLAVLNLAALAGIFMAM